MKKVLFGILVICVLLVAAVVGYGLISEYNLVKVVMVELTPNYMFDRVTRDFRTAETDHIIWYYPAEVQLPSGDMDRMEKSFDDASKFWGIDPVERLGSKIRFAWLPGKEKYDRSRITRALGERIQGRAFSKDGILYSIFSYTPHELNHIVAGLVANTTTLLDEGFANYLNKVNWDVNVHQQLLQAKKEGKIIPVEDLLTHSDFRAHDSGISYAEASLFVKYLVEEKGKDKFIELYREIDFSSKKDEVIAGFEKVYVQSFTSLITEWEEYLVKTLAN